MLPSVRPEQRISPAPRSSPRKPLSPLHGLFQPADIARKPLKFFSGWLPPFAPWSEPASICVLSVSPAIVHLRFDIGCRFTLASLLGNGGFCFSDQYEPPELSFFFTWSVKAAVPLPLNPPSFGEGLLFTVLRSGNGESFGPHLSFRTLSVVGKYRFRVFYADPPGPFAMVSPVAPRGLFCLERLPSPSNNGKGLG